MKEDQTSESKQIAQVGKMRNAHKFLVGKSEQKRPLRNSWKGTIKMDLKK
jgi:hypothetical protein